jgi:hypothetical protein
MGRSMTNFERLTAGSFNTTVTRREEKLAEAIIASNAGLLDAASRDPDIVSIIAATVATRSEADLLDMFPGIRDRVNLPIDFVIPRTRTFPPVTTTPPVVIQPEQPVSQIDLAIQLLLNKIPIAHEGHIITSEYHNTVRDALLAIASRLGLTVKPVSDLEVLNFTPNFQPPAASEPNSFIWISNFNKAVLPQLPGAGAAPVPLTVKGVLPVQLPEGAVIDSMIVRAARTIADKDKPNPKSFKIRLSRQKFDTEPLLTEEIIKFDLADKKEKIKEVNDVLRSLPTFDPVTARARALDLRRVDNQTYQYFIEAIWEGDNTSAKFEINSFQIFCEI